MVVEFLLVYVRDLSIFLFFVSGFYEWYVGVKNFNYKFMVEVVFLYCFVFYVFRVGVRCNNFIVINVFKIKFLLLFFGFNMLFYMEIYMRDIFV